MLPNAVRALRPIGIATAPTPLPVLRQHGSQRRAGQQQRAADARGDEHDDCPAGREQAAQRLADQRTDPSAGAAERVEVGHDLLGPAHDVQQAEQRQPEQSPAEARRNAAQALSLADQRGADGDEGDRHHVPAEAGEPADDGLDATAERTGEVEVDRQAEQDADGDEPDAGELVLAALHGLAELGARPGRDATWSTKRRPTGAALAGARLAVVVVFDRLFG